MDAFINAIGMDSVPLLPVLIKLVLAVFCGGVLGLERTRKRRAAGVRTYSIICLGAAVVMMTGQFLSEHGALWDPARMGAQVVSGIGFIGAGAIIVTGYHEIKGLTTAAGLWASACMGLAIGAGFYTVALVACAILFCVVYYGEKFQQRITRSIHRVRFYVMLTDGDTMTQFLTLIRENGMSVSDIEQMRGMGSGKQTGVVFALKLPDELSQQQAFDILARCPGVLYIEAI